MNVQQLDDFLYANFCRAKAILSVIKIQRWWRSIIKKKAAIKIQRWWRKQQEQQPLQQEQEQVIESLFLNFFANGILSVAVFLYDTFSYLIQYHNLQDFNYFKESESD